MRIVPTIFALVVLAAPLGACATLEAPAATMADAEKSLTLCHLAYQGAGDALKNAALSGALHGAAAAQAKALYDRAGAALDAADAADAAANASGVLSAIEAANALVAQLHSLVSQH